MFNFQKANEIHNFKYDYSKVNHINIKTKIVIICPMHGEFEQTPDKHIHAKQGCPKCKGAKIAKSKSFSINEFVALAKQIHNNKYDYSLVEYKNMHIHINIICPKHGVFKQKPSNHIYISNGCPACGNNTSKPANKWLESLNNKNLIKEHTIKINNKNFKVDAYDPNTNTIYEYFGVFWHGHPDFYNKEDINPKNKIKFGDLYQNTLNRIDVFKNNGYKFIFKWG